MKHSFNFRSIFFLWLAWVVILSGYQIYVSWRLVPQGPDYALSWTPSTTVAPDQSSYANLGEAFINQHVAWDSEYYLSIAMNGYDDPAMRAIPETYTWSTPLVATKGQQPGWISMNHAFFPFYPLLIRASSWPLGLLGFTPRTTAALAGIIVSLLGTLAAMTALYDLARDDLEESGGLRAAFYLLIWPASMFLAQVYTEGLFLGLSFGALALARRQKWIGAALLAAAATWTRASGALLLLPMFWYWWRNGNLTQLIRQPSWRGIGRGVLVLSPLVSYALWNVFLGHPFHIVEDLFFGRHLLDIGRTWHDIQYVVLPALTGENLQSRAYYLLEIVGILFGVGAGLTLLKRYPALALYSLALILFSLTTGAVQGMHRYVMGAPVIFLLPARWGKHFVFDRAWTLACILLMGVLAAVFSFDFFAG
ncbi:MAG: hypothetical protein JEZ00_10035 [Anaerolineaceae bacterium]|nr:hypothetical protein [Anaerolineaceae bacterium]